MMMKYIIHILGYSHKNVFKQFSHTYSNLLKDLNNISFRFFFSLTRLKPNLHGWENVDFLLIYFYFHTLQILQC